MSYLTVRDYQDRPTSHEYAQLRRSLIAGWLLFVIACVAYASILFMRSELPPFEYRMLSLATLSGAGLGLSLVWRYSRPVVRWRRIRESAGALVDVFERQLGPTLGVNDFALFGGALGTIKVTRKSGGLWLVEVNHPNANDRLPFAFGVVARDVVRIDGHYQTLSYANDSIVETINVIGCIVESRSSHLNKDLLH